MDFEFAPGAGQPDDGEANLSKISSAVVASQAGGAVALAALAAGATRIVPTDGVVTLPAGTDLDTMRVSGSDIVVTLPDGSQIVIVDGAVFVPQIVLGDVQVPAANLAALLIGQEPQPAAGPPQSSGGNFAETPGNIGDPFGLGDLLPPTELAFGQPRVEEIIPNLVDRDPTTIIITPDQPSGATSATASVDEAGLPARGAEPAGSNEPANSETTTGSIVFNVPDGLASVSLNGVAITAVGQVFTTPLGRLTITSIAPGNYGYSYTLTDNTNAGTNPTEQFAVVVTDSDGDTATATLTISILDDVPNARDDTDSVPPADYSAQTGNVITGAGTTSGAAGVDTPGADGAIVSGIMAGIAGTFSAVGGTINGQYGTLTIAANGSYTYTRNAGTPGGVNDIFSYQLTDGDGDTSAAKLTISIGDSPASVVSVPTSGAGTVVDEAGLPARGTEPPGSNAPAPTETTSGTITVAAPDGIASVAINGTTITGPGQTITVPTGTFTITSYNPVTGVIGYSFTLTDNTSGDTTTQTFTVTVTDTDGDSDTKPFTITILDDAPTAVNDSATQPAENAAITINVVSNDTPGADGVSLTTGVAVVPATLSGAGTLVYNNDGSFTYTPAPGEEGTVTFQYTITDGDGDPSTATVTITLLEDSIPSLQVSGDSDVAEAGLPARGSEPAGSDSASDSEIATGTLGVAAGNDSVASLVINGINVTNGGSVTGASGTLVITAVAGGGYSYAYTLTDNTAGDTTTDSFAITLTDSDGDIATDTLVIAIVDDVPIAFDDTDSLLAGATGPASGNVLTDASAGDAGDSDTGADTLGADGGSVTAVTGFGGAGTIGGTTTGQYGTLTLNADGSYSYVRSSTGPINATDTFTYTLTDGDGDTATATLSITLQDVAPVSGENVTVQLDDDALAGGNSGGTGDDPDAVDVTGTLAGSGGDGALTWAFQTTGSPTGFSYVSNGTGIDVFQGTTKVLAVTLNAATGSYTTTQLAPIVHSAGNDENNQAFTLNYTVTDEDGDAASGTLAISVDDDTPTAVNDTDSILSGSSVPATGNVITDAEGDGGADSPGADGGAAIVAVNGFGGVGTIGGTTTGQYGTLTLNSDGSYSYVRDNGTPGNVSDVFTYTLTDADGDTTTATLTISIEDATPVTGPNLTVLLDDDALTGGNPGGTGDDNDADNLSGTLAGSGGDGALTWAFQTTGNPAGFTYVANGSGIDIFQGATKVLAVTLDAATGAYGVSQLAPIQHTAGADENNQGFTLNYTVTDVDGDSATGTLAISVDDDTPTATNDTDAVTEDGPTTASGNVLTGVGADGNAAGADSLGADGPATGGAVTAIAGGTIGSALAGTYGSITLDATGGYTYTLNNALPAVQALDDGEVRTDTFTYTITDLDGDTATATLTITINGTNDAPVVGSGSAVVSEEGLAGANPDMMGATDTTDSATASGTIGISDADVEPSTVTLGDPGAVLTSGGATVTWSGVGTATLIGSVGATEVIRIVIDNSGNYTVTLSAQVDHAGLDVEDVKTIAIPVSVSDGTETVPTTLMITIEDDSPLAANDTDAVTEDGQTMANGNVLTGVGSDGNAAGADSLGADGPATGGAVTAIAGGTIGSALAGTYGALTLNADGSYSYVLDTALPAVQALDDGETRTDTFSYTITDGDGDTATATLTITVNGTNDAPVVSPATAIVSEEGLAGGNRDTAGSADTTNSAIASGTILASDVDVEPLAFTLGDPGAVLTADGSAVTWTGAGTGTLVGSVGAVEVIRVTINSSGAYTVTLSQSVDHPGINIEDNVTFSVPVAVSDGTATSNTTLTITIEDDSPIARNDNVTTIEGAPTITGNVLTNDSFGADTPGTLTTTGTFNLGHGTLTINANGSYSYTPIASVLSNTIDSFTYTIRDADGDTSTATLRFTFDGDANMPTAGTTSASVDDDALSGGIAGGTGDLPDANTDGDNNQATFSGVLPHNFGIDGPGVVTLAGMNGLTGIVGTETVTYAWNGTTNTLTATGPRGALFTVVANPATGAYTVTLLDNVLHVAGSNENDVTVALAYRVTDSDGSAVNGVLTVNFDDDTPTLGVIQNGTANNNPASAVSIGTLHFAAGADGVGSVGTIALTTKGLTSGGKNIVTSQSGNVLTGYADNDGSETVTAGDTSVFTLTLNPTAGTSGQYVFDLTAPLDGVVVNNPIGGSSSFGAGPTQSQVLTTSGTTNLAVVSGWTAGASFNAAQWFNGTNALPAGLTLSSVNGSTGGWGVANNNFTAGEFLRFDFGAPMDDFDAGGPYVAPAVVLPEVSYATFNLVAYGSGDTIQFRIHYTDGTSSSASVNGAQTGYTLTAPAGKFIDWIDLYTPNAGGSGKVSLTGVGVQNTVVDRTLGFSVTLNDADGDPVTGAFTVNVKDGNTPSTPVAPVVLDLDHNGVAFISASAGVTFDFNGDGVREHTAWVGPGDGLLAIDRNGDGLVNDGSEVVFATNGLSDLQGLAAQYDSNRDGVLDANDVDFGKFGVWQDVNGNGVTDAGEFQSLTAAGIASIGLVSDGQAYTVANGEVDVLGQATYTKADGSTGAVADAVFATGGAAVTPTAANDDQKTVTSSTAGIASALVAASLIATVTTNESGTQDSPASATIDHVLATSNGLTDPVSAYDNAKVQPLGEQRVAISGDEHSSPKALSTTHFRGEAHVDSHVVNDGGESHANSIVAGLLAQTDLDPVFFASHDIGAEPITQAMDAILIAQNAAQTGVQGIAAVIADALDGGASGAPSMDTLLDALTGSAGEQQFAGLSSDGAAGFGDASLFAAMAQTMADMAHQQTLVHLETAATMGHA